MNDNTSTMNQTSESPASAAAAGYAAGDLSQYSMGGLLTAIAPAMLGETELPRHAYRRSLFVRNWRRATTWFLRKYPDEAWRLGYLLRRAVEEAQREAA